MKRGMNQAHRDYKRLLEAAVALTHCSTKRSPAYFELRQGMKPLLTIQASRPPRQGHRPVFPKDSGDAPVQAVFEGKV